MSDEQQFEVCLTEREVQIVTAFRACSPAAQHVIWSNMTSAKSLERFANEEGRPT